MKIETKYYPDGTKKKEIIPMLKNGDDFRLVIRYLPTGNILDVMERPNMGVISPEKLVSGAHIVATNPEQNHCDFFFGNLKYIERPKEGQVMWFGYRISGGTLLV